MPARGIGAILIGHSLVGDDASKRYGVDDFGGGKYIQIKLGNRGRLRVFPFLPGELRFKRRIARENHRKDAKSQRAGEVLHALGDGDKSGNDEKETDGELGLVM